MMRDTGDVWFFSSLEFRSQGLSSLLGLAGYFERREEEQRPGDLTTLYSHRQPT